MGARGVWDSQVINVLATDGGLLKTKRSAAPRELSLRAVVTSTFQSPLCNTVHHRVAIHDATGAVTTIISQSDLVRLFRSSPQQLQPHGTRTLTELNLGTQQVCTAAARETHRIPLDGSRGVSLA